MNVKETVVDEAMSLEWDSYEAFLEDYVGDRVYVDARLRTDGGLSMYGSEYWYGMPDGSVSRVMERIRDGWPELAEQLDAMLRDLPAREVRAASRVSMRRRKRGYGDSGDALLMERVWSGELERAWQRPHRVDRTSYTHKRATVFFNVATPHTKDNASALWRAALCRRLCEALAARGRALELWSGASFLRVFDDPAAPRRVTAAICVKSSGHYANDDRICTTMSVAFFRTIMFMAVMFNSARYTPRSTYGYPSSGLPHVLAERARAGELVVEVGECYSNEEAEALYDSIMNRLEAK